MRQALQRGLWLARRDRLSRYLLLLLLRCLHRVLHLQLLPKAARLQHPYHLLLLLRLMSLRLNPAAVQPMAVQRLLL